MEHYKVEEVLNPLLYAHGENPFDGKIIVVETDPRMASQMLVPYWLGGYFPKRQRGLDLNQVRFLAGEMRERWDIRQEPGVLGFCEELNTVCSLDIQHRLHAVKYVKKEMPLPVRILRFTTEQEMDAYTASLSQGAKVRTPKDRAKILGFLDGVDPLFQTNLVGAARVAKIGLNPGGAGKATDVDLKIWFEKYGEAFTEFQEVVLNSDMKYKFGGGKKSNLFPIWKYMANAMPIAIWCEILRCHPIKGKEIVKNLFHFNKEEWYPLLVDKRLGDLSGAVKDMIRGNKIDVTQHVKIDASHWHTSLEGRYVAKLMEYVVNKELGSGKGKDPEKMIRLSPEEFIKPYNFTATSIDGEQGLQKLI